jgi:hypothetical protein
MEYTIFNGYKNFYTHLDFESKDYKMCGSIMNYAICFAVFRINNYDSAIIAFYGDL